MAKVVYREDDQIFHMIQHLHHAESVKLAESKLSNGFGILDSGVTSHLAPG
jgi:hypothetical protein